MGRAHVTRLRRLDVECLKKVLLEIEVSAVQIERRNDFFHGPDA